MELLQPLDEKREDAELDTRFDHAKESAPVHQLSCNHERGGDTVRRE